MFALSGWHSATFHDDAALEAMSTHHVHDTDAKGDPEDALHLAAHAVGQGLAIPSDAVAGFWIVHLTVDWMRGENGVSQGLDPTSLLRPPQR